MWLSKSLGKVVMMKKKRWSGFSFLKPQERGKKWGSAGTITNHVEVVRWGIREDVMSLWSQEFLGHISVVLPLTQHEQHRCTRCLWPCCLTSPACQCHSVWGTAELIFCRILCVLGIVCCPRGPPCSWFSLDEDMPSQRSRQQPEPSAYSLRAACQRPGSHYCPIEIKGVHFLLAWFQELVF